MVWKTTSGTKELKIPVTHHSRDGFLTQCRIHWGSGKHVCEYVCVAGKPTSCVMQDGEFIHLMDLGSASASEFSVESLKDIQQEASTTTCATVERFVAFDVRYVRA